MHTLRLTSFGFEENATFNLNISAFNKSMMIAFLIPEDLEIQRVEAESLVSIICDPRKKKFISEYNSSLQYTDVLSWNGTIHKRNVYHPYVFMCYPNSTKYYIMTDYQNVNSHLDFRDYDYPYFYALLSYIYILCTAAWIINELICNKFAIPLHTCFALVSGTKAILSALYADLWECRHTGKCSYNYFGSELFNSLFIFHYVLLLTVPILAMSGWCIYRDFLSLNETYKILFANVSIVIGFWKINYIYAIKDVMLIMLLLSIGLMVFLRVTSDYISNLIRIDDSISSSHEYLRKKINLLASFSWIVIFFGTGYIIFYILFISLNLWNITQDVLIEVCILIFTFIEMYFFMYRNKYHGEPGFETKESQLSNLPIYYLNEPKQTSLAVIDV